MSLPEVPPMYRWSTIAVEQRTLQPRSCSRKPFCAMAAWLLSTKTTAATTCLAPLRTCRHFCSSSVLRE
jgi:hypothetical protein